MKQLLGIIALLVAFAVPGLAQQEILQGSAGYPLMFLMIDSSDHVSAKTGLSPTVTLSKTGGSFASPAGSVSEIANGWYKVAGHATDTGTFGPIILHATGSGADPFDAVVGVVVGFDPRSIPTLADIENEILDALCSGHTTSATFGKIACGLGAPVGATIDADIRAARVVAKSAGFEWAKQFRTPAGALVISGTPTCTRSLDAVNSFASGTLTASGVTSNGLSEIGFSTGDVNGNYYVILKCTLSTASDVYEIFKIQQ